MLRKYFSSFLVGFLLLANTASSQSAPIKKPASFEPMGEAVANYLKPLAAINVKIEVDSVQVHGNKINIWFSKLMSDYSFRESNVREIENIVKEYMPAEYSGKTPVLFANGSTLKELSSRYYAGDLLKKASHKKKNTLAPLVTNVSKPYELADALDGKHIAVWQSHGFYYNQAQQRWMWQRARLFQTVEDIYTQSYVVPFLVPMLENAGAVVLLPRERDYNKFEVIVDNDSYGSGYSELKELSAGDSLGFGNPKQMYLFGENPFKMGTYRVINGTYGKKLPENYVAQWLPQIPKTDNYAVYVSYNSQPNSTSEAKYLVKHNGGETEFRVNQKMGGSTWIYLGTFPFVEGKSDQGVYLSSNVESKGKVVTADGVKFGGGMGNIAREPSKEGTTENVKSSSAEKPKMQSIGYDVEPTVSGYPRITEGARYWLQWAGFADTIYSSTSNLNDYNDDYTSRGRWVNNISGGSTVNPNERGFNIPVDMAFAFHTDAGTFVDDSIVGTLAIYTRYSNDSDKYPNGQSRLLAREMNDIIQTQIVDDIRALYEPNWSRRGLWDRSYAEARTPNVPTMLLELLSHQNLADMKYGLDPNFRFMVSRAIYKGMLKYFSLFNGGKYVVQPLPIKNFASEFVNDNNGNAVKLSWSPVLDSLEPTATPDSYIVYTRVENGGFDNGVVVKDTSVILNIATDKIYSYKVVALNDGGISFPSEILSVGLPSVSKETVMIVNGFDRVSAPYSFQSKDSLYAGFYSAKDAGVPYINDYSFIGNQYEFRREIPWMEDDSPGFGASYTNYEDKVIAGNTFDYPYVHGKAFMKNGYAFVSTSIGALNWGKSTLECYNIVDFIMGKQSQTKMGRGTSGIKYEVFPEYIRKIITKYTENGGNILLSGAYIATDLWDSYIVTEQGKSFAKDVLKFTWKTNFASTNGEVVSVPNPYGFRGDFNFHTLPNEDIYAVECADALAPASNDAYTIFRYKENRISAGVAYRGEKYSTVVLGFPIETLKSQNEIDKIITETINFFENK